MTTPFQEAFRLNLLARREDLRDSKKEYEQAKITLATMRKEKTLASAKVRAIEKLWENYMDILRIDGKIGDRISNVGIPSTIIDFASTLEYIHDISGRFNLSCSEIERIRDFRDSIYLKLNKRVLTEPEYNYIMQTNARQIVFDLIGRKENQSQ